MKLWARAAAQRQDMHGLDGACGVDRFATTSFLNSSNCSAKDKGTLRSIISGSLRLGERLHIAGLADSPVCAFCGLANESVHHCFWHCPAWEHLRVGPGIPIPAVRREWPVCTQTCSIFLEDPELHAALDSLKDEVKLPTS